MWSYKQEEECQHQYKNPVSACVEEVGTMKMQQKAMF